MTDQRYAILGLSGKPVRRNLTLDQAGSEMAKHGAWTTWSVVRQNDGHKKYLQLTQADHDVLYRHRFPALAEYDAEGDE